MQLHANKLPLFEARKFCASLLPSTHPLLFVQLQWLFFALPTGLGDRWRSNDPTKNKGFIINISMHGSWKLSNVQNLYQTSRKTSLQFLAGHWLFYPKKIPQLPCPQHRASPFALSPAVHARCALPRNPASRSAPIRELRISGQLGSISHRIAILCHSWSLLNGENDWKLWNLGGQWRSHILRYTNIYGIQREFAAGYHFMKRCSDRRLPDWQVDCCNVNMGFAL